jgi:hypothetical protein
LVLAFVSTSVDCADVRSVKCLVLHIVGDVWKQCCREIGSVVGLWILQLFLFEKFYNFDIQYLNSKIVVLIFFYT